jgi:hypothetical protein
MNCKRLERELLPAINACGIAGLFMYFYDGDRTWIILLVGLFFAFAKTTKDKIIEFFVRRITRTAHRIIFSGLILIYAVIFSIKKFEPQGKKL